MTGNGTAISSRGRAGLTLPRDETQTDNVVITAWH
jgi:hypothetical protein